MNKLGLFMSATAIAAVATYRNWCGNPHGKHTLPRTRGKTCAGPPVQKIKAASQRPFCLERNSVRARR